MIVDKNGPGMHRIPLHLYSVTALLQYWTAEAYCAIRVLQRPTRSGI